MKQTKAGADHIPKARSKPIRIGFLPLNDCAPLVVAHELGLFAKYGLSVELRRRPSWAELHYNFLYGELDAAHAPGTLPFLMRLGLTSINGESCPTVTGLVLSLQGNAITVSRELWDQGVRDAASLNDLLHRNWGRRTYQFAVDLPFSSEYFLLCQWLRTGGVTPLAQVPIIKTPPAEMFPMLKLGYLAGYCVGEPWTSVAVQAGVGMCVATSLDLAPLHPEKILLARGTFATQRADEHERLIAALLEACIFCEQPRNREQVCSWLARPQYVNAPAECIESGLAGLLQGKHSKNHSLEGLNIFQRHRANEPTAARAAWITGQLHRFFRWKTRPTGFEGIFRPDIFRNARRRYLEANEGWVKPLSRRMASKVQA